MSRESADHPERRVRPINPEGSVTALIPRLQWDRTRLPHAMASGTPFVGFGIADNGIMIMAGEKIDLTLGVKLGWSTLAASGFGNTISDVVGL